MGKTREFFKKIGDIKGTFHARMGTIKDRNSTDLTKAKELKKRCKNTQKKFTKKILMAETTTLRHLEPDILEYEVKRALGNINFSI